MALARLSLARAGAGLVVAAWLAAFGCAPEGTTRPGTGLILISEEQEFEMGDQFAEALRKDEAAGKVRFLPQPGGGYLDRLGRALAAASKRPKVRYEFSVIDGDEINAFAVPGHIYVYRGLVELAETEAEFAGALSHEIGHVVGRHSAKMVSQEMAMSLGAAVVLSAVGDNDFSQIVAGLIVSGALKKFGRDEERQADLLGAEQCAAAGIDPRGAARLFRKFERVFAERPNRVELFFADHPFSGERAGNVERHAAGLMLPANPRADGPEYQAWRGEVVSSGRPRAGN